MKSFAPILTLEDMAQLKAWANVATREVAIQEAQAGVDAIPEAGAMKAQIRALWEKLCASETWCASKEDEGECHELAHFNGWPADDSDLPASTSPQELALSRD